MQEQWADVEGYEGYYIVSNTGQVRSVERVVQKSDGVLQRRKSGKVTVRITADGYSTVRLSRDGVRKQFAVHFLVARTFVPGYFAGAEVHHIDFDRANNNANNLEWVTHACNLQHTINAGRHVSQLYDFSGANNPNYGNRKLSNTYAENPSLAKEKQSRPGATNGRATPVSMTCDGTELRFDYIRQCAEYLSVTGVSHSINVNGVASNISRAAKSGSKYLGYTFSFSN